MKENFFESTFFDPFLYQKQYILKGLSFSVKNVPYTQKVMAIKV